MGGPPAECAYQAFRGGRRLDTVGAANQGNWLRLLEALGAPELGNDPRFVNNATGCAICRSASALTRYSWRTRPKAARLRKRAFPAGPVLDVGKCSDSADAGREIDRQDLASHGRTGGVNRAAHQFSESRVRAPAARTWPANA